MNKLRVENIVEISPNKEGKGYFIHFNDSRKIWITKRRTIPALLILIKYGDGCEADLQRGSTRLPKITQLLEGKIPPNYIQDSYADANKPFSELWNEEGFVWIENKAGDRRLGSQKYVLHSDDHEKFFQDNIRKAHRQAPKVKNKDEIRQRQNNLCNLCGSKIVPNNKLRKNGMVQNNTIDLYNFWAGTRPAPTKCLL